VDNGTLDLLQNILIHPDTSNVVFIGTYQNTAVWPCVDAFVDYLMGKEEVWDGGEGGRRGDGGEGGRRGGGRVMLGPFPLALVNGDGPQ
jgi:hypothetical protein